MEAVARRFVKVHRVVSAPFEVNAWVVEDGDEAMIVDATTGLDFEERVMPAIRHVIDPARVKTLYLTHVHCDHVGGAAKIKRLTGCSVCMHEAEAEAVRQGDSQATLGAMLGLPQEPCEVDAVRPGDQVTIGNTTFDVLEFPGHTAHHSALHDPATGTFFGGDLVFEGGSFGRVDFPGGDGDALIRSLRRIEALELTNLYPGHMAAVEGDAHQAVRQSRRGAELMLDADTIGMR